MEVGWNEWRMSEDRTNEAGEAKERKELSDGAREGVHESKGGRSMDG